MPAPPHALTLGPVQLGLLAHAGGRGEPAARAWLAARLGHAADALPLQRDAHGRPRLGLPGLDCNWSHSGPHLLVALGSGARVGVDVEAPRPRPNAQAIAERYFHPDEAAALATVPPGKREAAFLRLWCAKEAVLKAHGRGLAHGLARFAIEGFERPGGALAVRPADDGLPPAHAWRLMDVPVPGAVAVLAWHGLELAVEALAASAAE